MKYINSRQDFCMQNTCVTLGKFDGLHKGHQLLFQELTAFEQQGLTSVIFTFDYHPENLFSEKEISLIYTEEEKIHLLERLGAKVLISFPFTKETAAIEPEDFIRYILLDKLDARAIVVGKDYRFGKGRRGDIIMLEHFQEVFGYELVVCDKLVLDHQAISSSRIRDEIKKGNIEYANEMLGNPYTIMGEVLHGKQIGRTLGMPTINLLPSEHKLLPPNGVYASIVKAGNERYYGVTNIGTKPTIDQSDITKGVETYLFDYSGDLYGTFVEVELYVHIRPEIVFPNKEELSASMKRDMHFAQDYFMSKPLY